MDGTYLAQLLLSKNYKVFGTFRRASTPNFWRIMSLGLEDKISLVPMDLTDSNSIINALRISQPTEVYNMAASSYVADSFECPLANLDITGSAVMRLLDAIHTIDPHIKFYQSSSSEMYGNNGAPPMNEESPMNPISPYGVAKLSAHHIVNMYRKAYSIHAVSGICFNHEAPLRGLDFVTRKISNAVAKIKLGLCDNLTLGNLDAIRDWGWAPEYVNGIYFMMQQDEPDDYVLATNYGASVREFAIEAMSRAGIDEKVLKQDKRYRRPIDIDKLTGDYTKAYSVLDWEPEYNYFDVAKMMVDADLQRWKDWQDGKMFPWDAYLYPNEAKVLRRCK